MGFFAYISSLFGPFTVDRFQPRTQPSVPGSILSFGVLGGPSAPFWPTVFPMGGLRPSVLQVVKFSDPSFVFAPARDGHNTIFCPFRFKSAVLALLLVGSPPIS